MITTTLHLFNVYQLIINFALHITIFIGTFYVAMYNTKLPHWHLTPLWYLGLANFAVAISILIEWTIGSEHPLSFWNIGGIVEIIANIFVALIALIMLIVTVKRKYKS